MWYLNEFIQVTCGNVIFALFTVGLLKICDKLSNPFRDIETSFPKFLYDKALNNNISTVVAGLSSYREMYPSKQPIKQHSNPLKLGKDMMNRVLSQSPSFIRVPPRLALWTCDDVAAWVRRSDDSNYKAMSTASAGGNPYYISEGRPYAQHADLFIEQSITGSLLCTLTEDDLENDFNISNKYCRREFVRDVQNLVAQMG